MQELIIAGPVWGVAVAVGTGLVKLILSFWKVKVPSNILRASNFVFAGFAYWIYATVYAHQDPKLAGVMAAVSILVASGSYDTVGQPVSGWISKLEEPKQIVKENE